jgi:hypothetical protein
MPGIVNKGNLKLQAGCRWNIHVMKCLVFNVY